MLGKLTLIFLVTVAFSGVAVGIPVDNGVEGDPEIECGPTSITINFNTRNEFEGQVYVKGLFSEDACRNEEHGRQVAGIQLPFESCNTRRARSLNPKGVFVSTVVIISFHPLFVTKVDRAYRIQCFYMEADKTVDTNLEVSMLTTDFRTQFVPMPICRYEILDGSPVGPIIQYALVGQQVYHKWTCDTETIDTFCMVVHSCFVDDTNGDIVNLIDENGCAADLNILNNLEYPTDLMGGVEAHVFKYADRTQLYFQCQITILVKEVGLDCPRPVCGSPPGRGAGNANPRAGPPSSLSGVPFPLEGGSPYLPGRSRFGLNRRAKRSSIFANAAGTLDVAQDIETIEAINTKDSPNTLTRFQSVVIPQPQDDVCISLTTIGVVIFLFSVVLIMASVTTGVLLRRTKETKETSS